MVHAINAWLTRLQRQILNGGHARDNQAAAMHSWQARQIRPGTWFYRDPRFGQRAAGKTALGEGGQITVFDAKSGTGTWTEAVLRERIGRLQIITTHADDSREWSR